MTNGKNIIVYSNNVAIASTRSNDILSDCALIEKRTVNSSSYAEYTPGQKSWKVTTNYLLASTERIKELLNVGNSYMLTIGTSNQGTSIKKGLSGTAILQQCQITATVGNLCQGSFVFQGSGPLTEV